MSKAKQTKNSHMTPYAIITRTAERAAINNNEEGQDENTEKVVDEINPLDSLDPSQALIVGILKDMISKLETNINTKLDRTVNEIREDVIQIKTHIERYNESMEEVQARISDTEDKVEKMSEVIEEIYDFKTEWEKRLKEIDRDACEIRKKKHDYPWCQRRLQGSKGSQ